MTRVKICCILSLDEARQAIAAGADALGLVSEMPSGPGVIPEAAIARIARAVPPPVATFLLTSRQRASSIAEQHARCGTTTVQICDRLPPGGHDELRRLLPATALVQVIHVQSDADVEEAAALGSTSAVAALLLDSGNQRLPIKELGGTGRTHDWILSERIRRAARVPVFLAGGLTPANVRAAIELVEPFGVDVCSGVRTDGRLDPAKLEAFIRAARG
jgi:phosphoribosylanthranilate isomerase